MTLTSTFNQQDTAAEASVDTAAAKGRATRLLCAVVLAAAVLAGTASQASAVVLNDGYGTYGTTNYRCDHRFHTFSASVNMVTQGGAYQTMGYRVTGRNTATGQTYTSNWVTTNTRGGWVSNWYGTGSGIWDYSVQYAWYTTSGWILTGWERATVQQAGLYRGVIEGSFVYCEM